MRLLAATLLAICGAAHAQDKDVEALREKARAEVESGKNTWERFVFEADAVSDDDLEDLVAAYDRAIDFYQRIAEASEDGDGEADVSVIRLARSTAKLRATLWAREMAVKAKAAAASRPTEPEPEAEAPPAPPEPPAPPSGPAPTSEAPEQAKPVELPTIDESREQRTAGIQGARNFVMQYFANRKYKSMIGFCGKATCNACRARVGHLNVHAARRAYWLSWSPLYRANEAQSEKWRKTLREWRLDPRKLPEVLTRLRITTIDYHGLWADVEWEEWGVTNTGRKTHDTVRRRLIRAGNRWFFFHEELDRDFFASEADPK